MELKDFEKWESVFQEKMAEIKQKIDDGQKELDAKIKSMEESLDKMKPKIDLQNSLSGLIPEGGDKIDENVAAALEASMDEENIDPFPDSKNYDDGDHEAFFEGTDKIQWQFSVKDKLFEGEMMNFYPTGDIKRILHMEKGVLEGLDQQFALNGWKMKEIPFKQGVVEGIFSLYHFGVLVTEIEMINGKLGSIQKNYYSNGKIGSIMRFENGKQTGLTEIFTQDGIKQGETYYKDGMKHGPEIYYYPSGERAFDKYYENNMLEGKSNDYYENGILLRTEKFSKGVSISHAKLYDHEGRLMDVES